jgi:hypothetical protein
MSRAKSLRNQACDLTQFELIFAQLIDLARHSRYLIKFDSASEPLAQAVEHLPFKQRVAGSNPARLTNTSPSSSSAQDTGLSRR